MHEKREIKVTLTATETDMRRAIVGKDAAWELAERASTLLVAVLTRLEPATYEGPEEEAGPALHAVAMRFIGSRIFRTIRAGMAVLSVGYEHEVGALDRVLVELIAHRKAILEDDGGQEALAWLRGQRAKGISQKVNAMQPTELYANLCHAAHGDPRPVLRMYDETGSIELGPRRSVATAASLLMYAGLARDHAALLCQQQLPGLRPTGLGTLSNEIDAAWDRLEQATAAEGNTETSVPPDSGY